MLEKVTALITRPTPNGRELLLFEHPHPTGGIQIPAGTVEMGEAHAHAAAREAREETGLADLPPGVYLTSQTWHIPASHRMVNAAVTVYARPDPASFDWARLPRGVVVQVHGSSGGFTHVTYAEADPAEAGPGFQITGWVATSAFTGQVERHFYHFAYHGRTPATWWVEVDNHRFRLFWASLAHLPALHPGMQAWPALIPEA